jgi:hypothetical protein
MWLGARLADGRPPQPVIPWLLVWAGMTTSWLLFLRARIRRGIHALGEAQALLNAGSHQAGGETCRRILDHYRGLGQIEAPALSNLSIAAFHEGDAPRALDMLDAVERAGWCAPGTALRTIVLQNRALYRAVLGQVAEAERCAREARGQITSARAEATMLVLDAVLAARTGRFDDLVALTGTSAATRRLQAKLLRLLRAWALSTSSAESTRDEVRVLIEGAKPIVPGELRYVTAHWPEFRSFLMESGLADAAN